MDLIMKMDISLTDSLCGMKKTVQTLDDRTLVLQTIPGKQSPESVFELGIVAQLFLTVQQFRLIMVKLLNVTKNKKLNKKFFLPFLHFCPFFQRLNV